MKIYNLRDVQDYLPQLAQWHQHEWSYLNPGEDLRGRIARMQQYLRADFLPSTFVAMDDELLGSAAIVAHDMDTRPELTPWLASVYVAPAYRRRGIARMLITHIIEQAARNDVEKLFLFTPNHSAYYQNLGWSPVEETVYRGIPVTIMSIDT
jgi:GNAT superfamily N-acetyltransferase